MNVKQQKEQKQKGQKVCQSVLFPKSFCLTCADQSEQVLARDSFPFHHVFEPIGRWPLVHVQTAISLTNHHLFPKSLNVLVAPLLQAPVGRICDQVQTFFPEHEGESGPCEICFPKIFSCIILEGDAVQKIFESQNCETHVSSA